MRIHKKLPLCAVCGQSLAHKGQLLVSYGGLDGNPQIGWHHYGKVSCLSKEKFKKLIFEDLRKDSNSLESLKRLEAILRKIEKRGPGRLVARREWWDRPGFMR